MTVSVFDIPHRGHYGLIREDLLGICDGSIPTAVLLNNFETWTKTREGEMQASPNKSPWLYEPAKVIQSWSPWIAIPTIRRSIKFLVKRGFLKSRKTKNLNDNSYEYQLNIQAVINALKSFWVSKQSIASDQNDHKVKGSDQNDHQGSDQNDHFSYINDQISNDLSPLPLSKKSAEGKRERKRKAIENPEPEVQAIAYGENQDENSSLAKVPNLGEDQFSAPGLTQKSIPLGFQIPPAPEDDPKQSCKEDLRFNGDETPWLNPSPRSKPNWTVWNPDFIKWGGAKFFKKFNQRDSDVYDAEYNFKQSLINDTRRIRSRWEQYEQEFLHKVGNVMIRLENGATVSDEEKAKINKHLPSVSRSTSARETLSEYAEISKTPLPILSPETEQRSLAIAEPVTLSSDANGQTDNVEAYKPANIEGILPASEDYSPEKSKAVRDEIRQKLNTKKRGLSRISERNFAIGEIPEEQMIPFVTQWINSPYHENRVKAEEWCKKKGYAIATNPDGSKEVFKF